jgi:hypothetical protein
MIQQKAILKVLINTTQELMQVSKSAAVRHEVQVRNPVHHKIRSAAMPIFAHRSPREKIPTLYRSKRITVLKERLLFCLLKSTINFTNETRHARTK